MNNLLDQLVEHGKALGLWNRGLAYRHYCRHQLFPGLDFKGKSVLDIGSGNGAYALWAASNGADAVVGLEPSREGSGKASPVSVFKQLRERLGASNVHIVEETFQQYEPDERRFDVILSHYSVNHLDERSCVSLQTDPEARNNFAKIFRKMHALMRPGGRLIMSDCTNRSFWSDWGMVNPFAPDIEWSKHQPPEVWIPLLEAAGFENPHVTWMYDNRLLHVGRLLRNRPAAYFSSSIFRIEMRKRA